MFERGSREQATQEFIIASLQMERHIRDHPKFATYQIERAGLSSGSHA
jgi:hypothetical protein